MSLLWETLKLLFALAVIVVIYFKWSYTYWKRKGVPYLPPKFPFGNSTNPMFRKDPVYIQQRKMYTEFRKQGASHGGFYVLNQPFYMTVAPDVIKNILVKDFASFVDRGIYYNEKDDPISAHLFSIGGEKWRHLRTKLTPTFTSGKMKTMFATLVACGEQMADFVSAQQRNGEFMDVKEVSSCYTTDVIGSCAFGLECNSFRQPDAEFRRYGKRVFRLTGWMNARIFFAFMAPKLANWLGIMMNHVEVAQFFQGVVQNTVEYRESNKVKRNDFMQLLIEMKNASDEKSNGTGLTMDELSAQAFVFFVAGFETSSTTMSFCLFELARNVDIQERVRDEIIAVLAKHGGEITYDSINEMKYLGQVVEETLRMYPPVPQLNRTCTKSYQIPDTDIVIEEGTRVAIPAYGLHHDPEYFPNPDRFDPDRFSEANRDKILPFTYLPFGEGPRLCIGMRFGLMQAKVGLSSILRNFRVTLNPKTEYPFVYDPFSFTLNTKGSIYLDVEKIC